MSLKKIFYLKDGKTNIKEPYHATTISFIYDWLRALYLVDKTSQNQTTQQLFTRLNANPSPTSVSPCLANSLHLIYRKQFFYRSRYNLVTLLSDLEVYLRDTYKFDVRVNYYSLDSGVSEKSDVNIEYLNAEFANLEEIKFGSIDDTLVRKQNLIAIFNVDFKQQQSSAKPFQQQTIYTSLNASLNSTSSRNFAFKQNLSVKTADQQEELQSNLKRIFCFLLVDCHKKTVYFYLYCTENQQYDVLKQYFENLCEIITQRYNLVNNIVLYKYGGLIGDQLLVDIKNLKANVASVSSQVSQYGSSQGSGLHNTASSPTAQSLKSAKYQQSDDLVRTISIKPTSSRQFTFPPTVAFSSTMTSVAASTATTTITATTATTTSTTTPLPAATTTFSLKQFCLNQTHDRFYNSIISLLNQQIYFYSLTLPFSQQLHLVSSFNATSLNLSTSDLHHVASHQNLNSLLNVKSTSSTTGLYRCTNQVSSTFSYRLLIIKTKKNPIYFDLGAQVSSAILYGVGVHVHLYEQQQMYRHARKIYEIAMTLTHNIQPANASSTTAQPKQTQLTTSDFYKTSILPVINAYHYCCTPVLFFPNWSDYIANDQQQLQPLPHFSYTKQEQASIETWHRKMRQHYLSEYVKSFESFGFVRLKDDRTKETYTKTDPVLSHVPHLDNQLLYFIKWIPNDGFLFITLNFEEIFLHCKLGYFTRYHTLTRTFTNELNKFLYHDFHIHSMSYDYHLLATNLNFTKATTLQSTLAFQTLQKFLDDFNEYYKLKAPPCSLHKLFKLVYEKYDCSLIPHKIGLIFDFILNLRQKNETITFIPIYTNLDNNIAIYNVKALNSEPNTSSQTPISCSPAVNQLQHPYLNLDSPSTSNSDYSKYLIVKIETNKVGSNKLIEGMGTFKN
jgi:hypothetical protein